MIRIIIPAYNEARPLSDLLGRLPLRIAGHDVAPLVVSDGSTDRTVAVAESHDIEVLALTTNRGKGTAVRAALSKIEDEGHAIVVLMDADGQHGPEDLEALVHPVVSGAADIAIGSRYMDGERRGTTPLNRYLVRRATVAALGRILGTRYADPYCGYRAFSRRAIETVEFCGRRYEGELEVLFDAHRCGLTVAEVQVAKIYGPGMSKMGAHRGRILGRLAVMRQYASTILAKTRELRRPDRHSASVG